MSMSAHGKARLCWVCRCSSGFCRADRPPIHIFAGENVCIQVMTPTQSSSAFASRHARRMASGVVSTGRPVTWTGIASEPERLATTREDCSAT